MTLVSFFVAVFESLLSELLYLRKVYSLPKAERPDRQFSFPVMLVDMIIGIGFVYIYTNEWRDMPLIITAHISAASPVLARVIISHNS